jgi:hypothetical protein
MSYTHHLINQCTEFTNTSNFLSDIGLTECKFLPVPQKNVGGPTGEFSCFFSPGAPVGGQYSTTFIPISELGPYDCASIDNSVTNKSESK